MSLFQKKTQEKIDKLKMELLEIEAEWDRLDGLGTMTEKQQKLADKMLEISKEVESLEGFLKFLSRIK